MKKTLFFISIPLSVIILSLLSIGFFAVNYLLNFKLRDVGIIRRREIKGNRLSPQTFNTLPITPFKIDSKHGYKLSGIELKAYEHNRFIICLHGVTENKISSNKYMMLFHSLGYNVVLFDHRRHGSSGGEHSSYGYYEKDDLNTVIDFLYHKYDNIYLGLHGESMGAATALLYQGSLNGKAQFLISDCAFSSLDQQIIYLVKEKIYSKLKVFTPILIYFINKALQIRTTYSLYQISPKQSVRQINIPILFIHTKNDTFIPYQHTQSLYNNNKSDAKMLWLPTKGDHATSYNIHSKSYKNKVIEFFNQYDIPYDLQSK